MDEVRPQGRSANNGFTALTLERCGERRSEETWLAAQLEEPGSRFHPVWGVRGLVDGDPPHAISLGREELGDALGLAETVVFLGCGGGRAHFAMGFSQEELPPELARHGRFVGLRGAAPLLPPSDAALFAYARAMVIWHRSARYCGVCGGATASERGGFMRRCSNPACGKEHFPRTDPAIIVLVERGERCLLGRQAWWEPGRFSVIAGFVEPGESFEAAVVREVREETAVLVDSVRYRSSQPWPFPGGVMVGFSARGTTDEIRLCDQELEDARWLTREELSRDMKAGVVSLPYRVSIAYRLIEEWFDAAPGWRLDDWVAAGARE